MGVGEGSASAVGAARRAVALGVGGWVGELALVGTLVFVGALVSVGRIVGACDGVGESSEIVV